MMNHLLVDNLSKENALIQQNNSYCRIISPEADPGTLEDITWGTLKQELTACGC